MLEEGAGPLDAITGVLGWAVTGFRHEGTRWYSPDISVDHGTLVLLVDSDEAREIVAARIRDRAGIVRADGWEREVRLVAIDESQGLYRWEAPARSGGRVESPG